MDSKQIWANLAVADVNRTATFYTTLGCTPNGKPTAELASFIFAANKVVIHFFLRQKLEKAMGAPAADLSKRSEVMFSLSVESKEEVENWLSLAKQAGGHIFRESKRDQEGYFWGGFADPD